MDLKQKLTNVLKKQIKEDFNLEIPPNPDLGDFSLPTFKLKTSPAELQSKLKLPSFIEKLEIKGPYLNFFIDQNYLAKLTIEKILKEKNKYGSSNLGKNKNILIEHTSINPNASPHLGRARNAIIGDSIVRILKFQNYKVETHYYVNDIGKQIAMLVLASKNKKPTFKQLLNLYIDFNKKIENNPNLETEVFTLLNKLEKGDKKTQQEFKKIVDICIRGQSNIFNQLGIKFDYFDFESDFLKETSKILKQLENTKRLSKDQEGRTAINLGGFSLPMESPILPLTRNDGTSMYLLRDIAYSIYKEKRGKERNIIILGEDQKLYFQQLKTILNLLKHKPAEVIHYSFVLLPQGKMSTRKGEVVLLEDFMKEIRSKAKKELKTRHKNLKSLDRLSEIIGYGAVKFTILKVAPNKNIIFDIKQALSFEGETSPYIQYAHTRASSILKKAKSKKPDYKITAAAEKNLITKLSNFPRIVEEASKKLQPHIIANYLLELSKLFNEFYHSCHVINEKEPVKSTRLQIVKAAKQTLSNALNLLGIETPELM